MNEVAIIVTALRERIARLNDEIEQHDRSHPKHADNIADYIDARRVLDKLEDKRLGDWVLYRPWAGPARR